VGKQKPQCTQGSVALGLALGLEAGAGPEFEDTID
jgi:hypothetical protein